MAGNVNGRRTAGAAWTRAVCALAAACSVVPAGAQPEDKAAPAAGVLPLRSVTLYRSGVALFERSGTVRGDADVALTFDAEHINDILKSLVVLDGGGGRVDSVRYASQEPLARRLASFGIDISDDPSAGEMLKRLRGAKVRLSTSDGEVSGTILNVEARPTVVQGVGDAPAQLFDLPWINLITDSGVKSYDLTQTRGFALLDAGLAAELSEALAAIAAQRTDRVRTVDIGLRGQGERRVSVAYVHESAVWKPSYRLVFSGDEGTGAKDRATIQGWAVVENTTDEDWEGVRLSLVSGRPVSFTMDLYTPLFVPRPSVAVPVELAAAPRTFEGAMFAREMAQADQFADMAMGAPGAPAAAMQAASRATGRRDEALKRARGGSGGMLNESVEAGLSFDASAFQAVATGTDAGEVFSFTVNAPVSVERRRSAMLPLLTGTIEARRVSIYDPQAGVPNPMLGAKLVNTTDLKLMPGPIAVYDADTYAGDAQIAHIAPKADRLIAYATDLDVTGTTTPDMTTVVTRLRLVRGVLITDQKETLTTEYAFKNESARARTIWVEHPRRDEYDQVSPEPAELTPAARRFELGVKAREGATLKVTEGRVLSSSASLLDTDENFLAYHVRNGQASAQVLEVFREAGRIQGRAQQAERRVAEADREREEIGRDQARIRENLGRVDRNSDLGQRYLRTLNDQETRLEAIRGERSQAEDEARRLREELTAFLESKSVE